MHTPETRADYLLKHCVHNIIMIVCVRAITSQQQYKVYIKMKL